jgi:hypothetical protein
MTPCTLYEFAWAANAFAERFIDDDDKVHGIERFFDDAAKSDAPSLAHLKHWRRNGVSVGELTHIVRSSGCDASNVGYYIFLAPNALFRVIDALLGASRVRARRRRRSWDCYELVVYAIQERLDNLLAAIPSEILARHLADHAAYASYTSRAFPSPTTRARAEWTRQWIQNQPPTFLDALLDAIVLRDKFRGHYDDDVLLLAVTDAQFYGFDVTPDGRCMQYLEKAVYNLPVQISPWREYATKAVAYVADPNEKRLAREYVAFTVD